jgi:hypothetical protein
MKMSINPTISPVNEVLTHTLSVTLKTALYMTNEQKAQVRDALLRFAANYASQAEAAAQLKGVSATTISQVKNNNWELMSESMWHNIARQVGFYCGEWQAADTSAYLLLRILLGDAQHYNMTYGIAIAPGLGKTFTAGRYIREHDETFYVAGNSAFNRRSFMTHLMEASGLEAKGNLPEMMQRFAFYVTSKEEPLLIIDDAHKLKDRVLHLLVILVNSLAGNAGVIIMGNDQLRMRIVEGLRLQRPGYDEIYKSIGRRFITLGSAGPKDVDLVCRANGIYDDDVIAHIREESSNNLHTATFLIQQHIQRCIAA